MMAWTKELSRILKKELLLLISLEGVIRPPLKSLQSTNPQSDCEQMEIQKDCYPPQEWLTNKYHFRRKTHNSDKILWTDESKVELSGLKEGLASGD